HEGLVQTFPQRQGKQKKEVHAVRGVDLDVAEGEVVGFLGPNGAGKTTTLRMLTTLLKPTAGTASVAGFDVATQAVDVRRSIGYCSQVGSTFSGAYAGDEVVDHGMLYGMSRKAAVAKGQELFDKLQLEGLWRRMPKNMSGGQKRRLDIAMALIPLAQPGFLDEPTTGLDPQARINLWQHIADLRAKEGATVFLTTHYHDEADALAVPDRDHRPGRDRRERHRRQPQGRRRGTWSTSRSPPTSRSPSPATSSARSAPTSRSRATTSAAGSPGRQGRPRPAARPGELRGRPGVDRGRPPHPRRRLPHPHRPLAARRRGRRRGEGQPAPDAATTEGAPA
ncbi:ABC transporter ATP-binding protein, partial [Nocardioides kongjuensis]|uniref:ABC transporter ATP-binding protein n=1 Tax=Nocardioides kongjuensis TaxID=349522 RepID=UPI0031E7E8FA